MKKFALAVFAVLVVGAVAYAEADAEPWESVYKQRDYKKPQRFSREVYTDYPVYSAFVDAGTIRATTVNVASTATAVVARIETLDAGAANIANRLSVGGSISITEGVSIGTCTLNGASPAVCTDTVAASTTKCVCAPVGTTAAIAAMNCAVSVSSTTLTITAANAANADVNWMCF